MSEKKRPSAPSGLGPAGRALWKRITADLELNPDELELLIAACRQRDDLAALDRSIARDGLWIEGSTGQGRLNPAVGEARNGRLALARLLGQIAIPTDDSSRPVTAASRRGQHAANVRWLREGRKAAGVVGGSVA